jgi:hypothetical protein
MSILLEQFRSLNKRLQAIQEDPDFVPPTGVEAPSYVTNPAKQPPNPNKSGGATNIDAYKPADGLKDIPGKSKSEAIATAQKMGLKPGDKFRWCMKYKVQAGSAQAPDPKPTHDTPWKQAGGMELPPQRESLESAVARLRSQLNELAYGEEDPKNPGYMWVPADGTSPLGDGQTPRQMIGTGTGGYVNAKMVPINKPPAPTPAPEPVTVTPVAEPGKIDVTTLPPLSNQDADPVKPQTNCDIETQARIKYMPSFNKAYAAAKEAGCPEFMWCQVVTVPSQDADPAGPGAAVGNTTLGRQAAQHWGKLALQHKSASDPYGLNWLKQNHPDLLDPKKHTPQEVSSLTNMITQMGQGNDKWNYIQR